MLGWGREWDEQDSSLVYGEGLTVQWLGWEDSNFGEVVSGSRRGSVEGRGQPFPTSFIQNIVVGIERPG